MGNLDKISNKQIEKVFNDTIIGFNEVYNDSPDEKLFKIVPENINIYKKKIIDIIQMIFEKYTISNIQYNKMIGLIPKEIQKRIGYTGFFTGIVITGFGDDEIFPSIYSCHIHGKLGKNLIITNEQKDQISNDTTARIIPFAQSEMVSSFMEGIDPDFEHEIEDQLKSLVNEIEDIVDKSFKKRLSVVKDNFLDYFKKYKWDNFINPVMNIVASLQKTELADMAESLVNLTSFKKQVSKESETVGGPIDVAVITKGDGLIWIKRKHYFDAKLNNHFFSNYFRRKKNGQRNHI